MKSVSSSAHVSRANSTPFPTGRQAMRRFDRMILIVALLTGGIGGSREFEEKR
jgi:hypothetical protein